MPFSHSQPPVLYFVTESYASLQILSTSKRLSWLEDYFPQLFLLFCARAQLRKSFLGNYTQASAQKHRNSLILTTFHLAFPSSDISRKGSKAGLKERPIKTSSVGACAHLSMGLQSSQFAA